jgi:non-heme Fe2+,alpha-ketoglutarate-dependent halogenase
MTSRLSASLAEQYRRDGFLFPVQALTHDQVRHYRDRLEAFEASHAGTPKEELHHRAFRFKPHLLHTWLDELIHLPSILDAVEDLIGPDILVWSSSFFIKDAHDEGFVSWHQDSTTYGLVGSGLVTAWVALTDSDTGNASMRVIPGTHRLGDLPHRDTFAENNVLSRGETVELEIDETQAVSASLKAGEMSLHHLRVVHGSPANTSDRRRIGYAIRYMAPHMRPASGRASALLVRGRDVHGHFEPESRPQGDFDEAALAAYERAMQLRTSAVFQDAPIKR